jgi:hypothetical protein
VVRKGRGIAALVALALVALIALAGTALADQYVGTSSQGGHVRVETIHTKHRGTIPDYFLIRWSGTCNRAGVSYHAKNGFGQPRNYTLRTETRFRGHRRYRDNSLHSSGLTSVVRTKFQGFRADNNHWQGSFQAWVQIRKNGAYYATCRTGPLHWSAASTRQVG